MKSSKYRLELWSPAGVLLADLSGRAKQRSVTLSRNEADYIEWHLDPYEFQDYCRSSVADPNELLQPGITEVRVRRGGIYLAGGQLSLMEIDIDATTQDIVLKANGWLNVFQQRYTSSPQVYTDKQATDIAWDLINTSQSVENGSFGITRGTVATVGTESRTYQQECIQTALQDLTTFQNVSFDMEFTPGKVFNTHAAIGSRRPEMVFSFPGNITSLAIPRDATNLANRIYVTGSGSGSSAGLTAQVDNVGSQLDYRVREMLLSDSSVIDLPTLTDEGNAALAAWSFPFAVPTITVNGNIAPFITDYHIGDYVTIRCRHLALLGDLNALYRIEKIDLVLDEDDNEAVTLYLSR